jgi:hypothetical protein
MQSTCEAGGLWYLARTLFGKNSSDVVFQIKCWSFSYLLMAPHEVAISTVILEFMLHLLNEPFKLREHFSV